MFAKFSVKNIKWLLATYFLVVFFFAGVILYRIMNESSVVDNSVSIWFMQDDPSLKKYDKYNADFGEQEWSLLMLKSKSESIYDEQFLEDLDDLTNRVSDLSHVIKVNSITNVRDNELGDGEMLEYTPLYPEDQKVTPEDIQKFRSRLAANPIFEKSLIQEDDESSTIVLIQNDNLIRKLEPYRISLIDSIGSIVNSYSSIDNHALAGTTVVNAELNRSSINDVFVFYTVISLMLIIFGWITMRSIKNITVMLSVVVGSIVPILGLLALFDIPYNMVTVMMPTILISLSVADIMHIIGHFHEERAHKDSEEAIVSTVDLLWKPSLWTSITTIVGFSSLMFSTVNPVFQLGLFASLGIALAYLITLVIAPGLLVLFFPEKGVESHSGKQPLFNIENFTALVGKHQYVYFAIMVGLLVSMVGLSKIKVDTDYTNFFSSKTQLTKAYTDIEESQYAQNPIVVIFKYPDGSTFTSNPYFSQIIDFENEIKDLSEITKVLSVNELLYQTNKAFLEEKSSFETFKDYSSTELEQLMLLAEMGNNDDINDFITFDRDQMQLLVLTDYMSSKQLDAFQEKLTSIKNEHISSDIEMTFTGTTVLWANMDEQVSHTQLSSLIGVFVFLLIFFPFIFGSLKIGLFAVFVNILPISITYGIMGLLGIEINMATAIIGGISLGIVTDDTIHYITSFKLGLEKGLSSKEAASNAINSVGRSIILTSVILIGSFLTMATSNFLPTFNFGILISICILVALFIDLMILPNVISRFQFKL